MINVLILILAQISIAFSGTYDFSGTVQINGCSGFFVGFLGSKPSDQAIIMTAGHCARLSRRMVPGEVITGVNSRIPVKFLNADGSLQSRTVHTDQLIYATVTGTDISLYSLESSYDDVINAYGVEPLLLSDKRPTAGENIQVLSSALQAGYSCAIDGFVFQLQEEDYVWRDSLRYTRNGCHTVGGTSGSPVINSQRVVVGINNTGNLDGEACTGNNACEISSSGQMTSLKGSSYGQQTYQIYSCLTKDRNFDLGLKGCRLYR